MTCLQKDPGSCHKGFVQCTAGLTMELLKGVPTDPPDSKLIDYWATLSSCLTGLSISIDPADKQLLQPIYLNQLTSLTRLELGESGPISDWADEFHYALKLPALKVLCVDCLKASNLQLQCPQLKTVHIESFISARLHLQASLKHLHYAKGGEFSIHEGFPITNLIGLTCLSLRVTYDIDTGAALSQALPLMTRLRILNMVINMCSLPVTLPSSLRDVTLRFSSSREWDSSVIPLLQQLPYVESICIIPFDARVGLVGDLSLDHDLRPFLAMRSLRLLQLGCEGHSHVWKASALRQLGEFEAEVEVLRLCRRFKAKVFMC